MAVDTTSPRTRRAILIGAIGAAGATVAAAVGRASPVSAANNDPVLVGHTYTASTVTEIDASGHAGGFIATSDSGVGLAGESQSGIAVSATSETGVGVYGGSSGNIGVYGLNSGANYPAILGQSFDDGAGVQGYSGGGNDTATVPPVRTGVYGFAVQAPNAVGVKGESTLGKGVVGVATSGTGVVGRAATGRGGMFSGDAAQVRLVPNRAATHPASGSAGDLFMDASHRLWLCKGTTHWKQIA